MKMQIPRYCMPIPMYLHRDRFFYNEKKKIGYVHDTTIPRYLYRDTYFG